MIVDHSLNDAWSITSTAGWREYDSYEDFDADGAGIYLLEFADDSRGRQFSGEIRADYKGLDGFNGFFGASYYHEKGETRMPFYTDERQLWPFLAGSFRSALIGGGVPASLATTLVPPANPFVPQQILPATFAAFNNAQLSAELRGLASLAGVPLRPFRSDEYTQTGRSRVLDLFNDGTWQITGQLDLTAGVRYTREKKDSGYEASNSTAPTLGFIVYQIPGYPYLPTAEQRSPSNRSSSSDWRLIGRFEFSKALNAYAGVSRGHRPESLLLDSTTTTRVAEEQVINYEAGLKGTMASGRSHWSASLYRYDYQHFQTTVLSLGRFAIDDAGNATGQGFEFSLQGRVNNFVSVFANYAYTDATFDSHDDQGRPQQYAGYRFRLTPKNPFSVGGTFTIPRRNFGRFFATPIWSYKSDHYFQDNNSAFDYGVFARGAEVTVKIGFKKPMGRSTARSLSVPASDWRHGSAPTQKGGALTGKGLQV